MLHELKQVSDDPTLPRLVAARRTPAVNLPASNGFSVKPNWVRLMYVSFKDPDRIAWELYMI